MAREHALRAPFPWFVDLTVPDLFTIGDLA